MHSDAVADLEVMRLLRLYGCHAGDTIDTCDATTDAEWLYVLREYYPH